MAIDKSSFTLADIEAYKDAAAKRGALTAMVNYYRNVFQGLFDQPDWGILPIPTLMIWGENDSALGTELTYNTQAYVPDLEIHYIPNCSHWVQQEKPELVNQYMRNFLRE
jgi:pimeloyl-ACP methyl ester carboxylesterase